jgi:transposase
MERKAYPSDISDEEWALVAPYLTLMTEDAPQRDFPLREVFNGLRYILKTGAPSGYALTIFQLHCMVAADWPPRSISAQTNSITPSRVG